MAFDSEKYKIDLLIFLSFLNVFRKISKKTVYKEKY